MAKHSATKPKPRRGGIKPSGSRKPKQDNSPKALVDRALASKKKRGTASRRPSKAFSGASRRKVVTKRPPRLKSPRGQ